MKSEESRKKDDAHFKHHRSHLDPPSEIRDLHFLVIKFQVIECAYAIEKSSAQCLRVIDIRTDPYPGQYDNVIPHSNALSRIQIK